MKQRLGILGGMGPMATVECYRRITESTPANSDQQHLDIMILSHASMPDRSSVILGGDDRALIEAVAGDLKAFEDYGCTSIAIPCNTFHYFYDIVQSMTSAKVYNMVKLAVDEAAIRFGSGAGIAVFGTEGTLRAGVYEREFEDRDLRYVHLPVEDREMLMSAIYDVKGNDNRKQPQVDDLIDRIISEGAADGIILACTELSIIEYRTVDNPHTIDAMDSMVKQIVKDLYTADLA